MVDRNWRYWPLDIGEQSDARVLREGKVSHYNNYTAQLYTRPDWKGITESFSIVLFLFLYFFPFYFLFLLIMESLP
jgi:hypothetical protein